VGARGRALTGGLGRSATDGKLANRSGPVPGDAGDRQVGPRGRARANGIQRSGSLDRGRAAGIWRMGLIAQ
jgi:hypothetical protein